MYLIAFTPLFFNLLYFLSHVFIVFSYPFSFNHVEGAMWGSLVAAKTFGLYPNYQLYPYLPTSYPPLFYLLALPLHSFFHLGLTAGRLISLTSTLLIAGFFARLSYCYSRDRFLGLLLFLAFLSSPDIFYWGTLYRVDLLLSLFLCLALYFGLVRSDSFRSKMLALLFFWLAFVTKSSFIVPPIVVFGLWLSCEFQKDRTIVKTLGLITLFSICLGLTLGLLQIVTLGQYIPQVFGLMTSMSYFNLTDGINLLLLFFKLYWPLLTLVVGLLLFLLQQKKLAAVQIAAFSGLAASFLYILIFGSRMGSDTNYFLESYLWLFLAICFALPVFWKNPWHQRFLLASLAIFALATTPCSLNPFAQSFFEPSASLEYFGQDKLVKNQIVSIIKPSKGDVLTDDAAIAILAGKMPVFEPYI
ncbi:MAG: hypothetical protein KKD13_00365, partial [Candidatus Margulisbacteria bacterium]|nr:hypothetical protein [Candidatus Margulisiibacteriota bacterium]